MNKNKNKNKNEEKIDLLQGLSHGGCSAKLPASELAAMMQALPLLNDARLLVGTETHDDAAVWKINDEVAIIQTTDFFPPLCSDPYEFGEIAAANALSDVYAMGGEAVLALNLVMFPTAKRPLSALAEILAGGAAKIKEAGAVLAGGHTIDDDPPKYGLSVMGTVHPERIISNAGLREGDLLILTKPLGSGVVLAGQKVASEVLLRKDKDVLGAVLKSMKQLNKEGARLMQKYNVRGATDITGFGLLGHALRMAQASKVNIHFFFEKLPVFAGVMDLLEEGCIPGAAFRNSQFVHKEKNVQCLRTPYNYKMLMADAQTSGGLLMGVRPELAEALLLELINCGYSEATIIGEARTGLPGITY